MEWSDYLSLRSLAESYARGADRRDSDLFAGVFAPDAVLLVFNPSDAEEPTGQRRGDEELRAVPDLLARYACTYHFLGNMTYDVEGDEATGEVYCTAHHLSRGADGDTDLVMMIRYRDRYRRLAHGWRITERRVLVDWTELRPVRR